MRRLVANRNLYCLRNLINEYLSLNQELARDWKSEKDVPWWYNERASLSILAGAIWRKAGYAFEEYSIKKKGSDYKVNGRIDMEFGIGNNEFIVEAKQCWIPCNEIRDFRPTIERKMYEAKNDVWRCFANNRRRLAIVFGAPYTLGKSRKENLLRMKVIEEQSIELNYDIFARITPTLPFIPTDEHGHQYTTGFVWIAEVRKSPNKSWEATRSSVRVYVNKAGPD